MFLFHEQNALKSLEKEVILSWKSLENHSQVLYEPCLPFFRQQVTHIWYF